MRGQVAQPAAQNPFAINRAIRDRVLDSSISMTQQIFQQTINPANQTSVTVTPRNVGLVKRFIVKVTATANNTDGALNASLTSGGVANLLASPSGVIFTDLTNNTRIQTSGLHLTLLRAMKHRWPFGQVTGVTYEGSAFGNNFAVVLAPATINQGASSTIQQWYEIPLAYSDEDLRGAIFANVVNTTMQLQLSLNTAPFVAAATDSTYAIYKGAAGNLSNVTITVYQEYLDQLPRDNSGNYLLPNLDLATVYELKNTNFTGIAAGADFPIPYANFRRFLSTILVYNHDASADAGRVGGTDISYMALQSANFTNIWKKEPQLIALAIRDLIQSDLPNGMYYLSSRKKPISTITYGNMQLMLNASTAAASAYVNAMWESFGDLNTLTQAGSLAG